MTQSNDFKLRKFILLSMVAVFCLVFSFYTWHQTGPNAAYILEYLFDNVPASVDASEYEAKWTGRVESFRFFSFLSGAAGTLALVTMFTIVRIGTSKPNTGIDALK